MRKYLFFYIPFTILVAAGAYFYKNACAAQQEMEVINLSYLLGEQKVLLQYKIRDNQHKTDRGIKANSKFKARRSAVDLLEKSYAKFSDNVSVFRLSTNYSATGDRSFTYQKERQEEDIEKYEISRNFLKKYYQDSLLQNSIFYKDKKNWICLDSTHEAGIAYFFKNYKKYSPTQQYTWIDSDRLYWVQNFERFTSYIANDISEKTTDWAQSIEKKQQFRVMMSSNAICSSTTNPFEASISIAALNNSEHLKYTFNEQSIKSKNGQVVFKIPSGAASDDLKTMVMTATITNPVTGESSTAMSKKQYRIFK